MLNVWRGDIAEGTSVLSVASLVLSLLACGFWVWAVLARIICLLYGTCILKILVVNGVVYECLF